MKFILLFDKKSKHLIKIKKKKCLNSYIEVIFLHNSYTKMELFYFQIIISL